MESESNLIPYFDAAVVEVRESINNIEDNRYRTKVLGVFPDVISNIRSYLHYLTDHAPAPVFVSKEEIKRMLNHCAHMTLSLRDLSDQDVGR